MRVLLIGAGGQLGFELYTKFHTDYEIIPAGRSPGLLRDLADISYLDLSSSNSIRDAVRDAKPDVIVNAGAYTAVDKAECEEQPAFAINAEAPGILAELAKSLNIMLVHFSTDYVFDGTKNTPYTEQDRTNPLNVYGKSKLMGEQAVIDSGCQHMIFRTAWLYSMNGKNFVTTIRRLAKERDVLKIVNDQYGAPTWCGSIAEALLGIIRHIFSIRDPDEREQFTGLYHMTCGGTCTWYEFAQTFIDFMREHGSGGIAKLEPISSEQYPSPVTRPAYSVLDNTKLSKTFGLCLPDWQTALKAAWFE